jgi:hypothetical protein
MQETCGEWPGNCNEKAVLRGMLYWPVIWRILDRFLGEDGWSIPKDLDALNILAEVPEKIRIEARAALDQRVGGQETKIMLYIKKFLALNNMSDTRPIDHDAVIMARLVLLGDMIAARALADKIRE